MLLLLVARLAAVSVDWSVDRAVDVALRPSSLTTVHTRTVVLPGGTVTKLPTFWSEEDLFVQNVDNTLIMQLRNPQFSGTLTVYDDQGNIYLLDVRAAEADEPVDGLIILRPPATARAAGGPPLQDSDAAVTQLMRHMVGGPQSPQITGSVVTRVEDGQVLVGRRIFADDDLQITMTKVFRAPRLRGCELLVRFHGERPVRFEMERLAFPGALAVYASDQVLLDPARPRVGIDPGSVIRLYYVYEE